MFKTVLTGLFLVATGYAKEFSQTDVEGFLKGHNFVSNQATPTTYDSKDGKFILTYDQGNTKQKFVLKPDSQENLEVVFSERFTSYSVSVQAVNPGPQVMIEFGKPIMEGGMASHRRWPNRMGQPGVGQRRDRGGCMKMRREMFKKKLFQTVPELEGGEILSVEKQGWQKGKGVEFICVVEKEGKKFMVDAFYRPRRDQLNVMDMKQLKEQKPLEIGLEYIANIFKKVAEPKDKGLILGSEGEMEYTPIIGSEGEKEGMHLLGSEGEKERVVGMESEEQAGREAIDDEDDEDVEIEEDGLITESSELVGQNENIVASLADEQEKEDEIEEIKPQLRDQRRLL